VKPDYRMKSYYSDYSQGFPLMLKQLYSEYIDLWISNDNPAKNLLNFPFGNLLLRIHNRNINETNEVYSLSDCCIPVIHRLICKVNGELGFCDKDAFEWNIGNVYDGLDLENIKDIINKFNTICSSLCVNCWAIRFCRCCFSFASTGSKLSVEKMREFCIRNKKSVEIALQMYVEIMEKNPKAFENNIYMKTN
ncbi:MAG: hypothetical protein JSW62_03320, partial [Thermoplasmatales archaeon]